MAEAGIGKAVEIAMEAAYWNPRPMDVEPLTQTLRRAWAGERPVMQQDIRT
jgi:hypothetical protein